MCSYLAYTPATHGLFLVLCHACPIALLVGDCVRWRGSAFENEYLMHISLRVAIATVLKNLSFIKSLGYKYLH